MSLVRTKSNGDNINPVNTWAATGTSKGGGLNGLEEDPKIGESSDSSRDRTIG